MTLYISEGIQQLCEELYGTAVKYGTTSLIVENEKMDVWCEIKA